MGMCSHLHAPTALSPGKKLPVPLWLGSANNMFVCCQQERGVLVTPDIKPRFLGRQAHTPVTTIQPDLALKEEKEQHSKEESSKKRDQKSETVKYRKTEHKIKSI